MDHERHLSLFGATALGVGAIVGGGILALAGIAFATTGPSAIVAFGLNGAIAFITAASFAQQVRRFPESGGLYIYAKKVLSIEVAFLMGWVVWFASILAGVLYALGFAAFALEGLGRALQILGRSADWVQGSALALGMAVAATALYTTGLMRTPGGRGNAATIGKVIVFAILLGGGAWAWAGDSPLVLLDRLRPFLSAGPIGLIQAMGYTFIALQGFDLIASVAGEVRDPTRTVPRAMYLSLGLALVIYLPLLFLLATVGAPETGGIGPAAASNPEGLVAEAAERFLGASGYWLVIGAGVLSMLSALRANLLAASRVAFAMARDRTLPGRLGRIRTPSGTPAAAVAVTGALLAAISLAVGNVAVAGAASSLIFLISFAMVHWTSILAARRSGQLRSSWIPLVGAALCLSMAVFQALVVPSAGSVVLYLLVVGAALYLTLFASGARLADVRAEARDPDLARLRGRSPLVLVPIANPASAASLVDVAGTLRTPGTGRVLLLSIVRPTDEKLNVDHPALRDAEAVLAESLQHSLRSSLVAETLFTIAPDIWAEISRVAGLHNCETVLLGLPNLTGPGIGAKVEVLIAGLEADVVVLRAPRRWRMDSARRVLVPVAGHAHHSRLRARLIASLSRSGQRSLTFLGIVRGGAPPEKRMRFERDLRVLVADEAMGECEVVIDEASRPIDGIIRHAADADLIILGMHRPDRAARALGGLLLDLSQQTNVPIVVIGGRSRRGSGLGPWRLTG
jgi:amino acid transporter